MFRIYGNHDIYITIGIVGMLYFLCCVYCIKKIVEKRKIIKKLYHSKESLITRTNDKITNDKSIEAMINDIQKNIATIKYEAIKQSTIGGEEKDKIEKEINIFYNKINNQQKPYQVTNDVNSILHKEQIKIMNQNIHKFLLVYREKENIIEAKNRSIEVFQQKINTIENRLEQIHRERKEEQIYRIQEKIKKINRDIQDKKKEIKNMITVCSILIFIVIGGYILMYKKYIIYYQNIEDNISVNSFLQVSKRGFSNRFLKP